VVGKSERHGVEYARTERGLERLIFFTDAVVAIAITLIALPLVDSAREVRSSTAADWLSENTTALIAAGISFVVISAFWREHHTILERANDYSVPLLRVNMLWLVGVVCIPIATVLIVYTERNDRVAVGLYLGILVYTMVITRLIELVLHRSGQLVDHSTGAEIAVRWIYVAFAVLIMVLGIAFPRVGTWWLLLLLIARPIQNRVQQSLPPAAPAPAE
jgi:uncharacterized membrane protein